jgi:hypothetical protein
MIAGTIASPDFRQAGITSLLEVCPGNSAWPEAEGRRTPRASAWFSILTSRTVIKHWRLKWYRGRRFLSTCACADNLGGTVFGDAS